MADFYIKRNDTSPVINAALAIDGSIADLTGATVRFHMGSIVDAEAEIISEQDGTVRYSWIAADTVTAGRYPAEFEVTFVDGRIETFPNTYNDELIIIIPEDLA